MLNMIIKGGRVVTPAGVGEWEPEGELAKASHTLGQPGPWQRELP